MTSAFNTNFAQQAQALQNGGGGSRASRAGKTVARRPVRGIEIKDDTYANLKVIMADGSALPLLDSSSSTGTNTDGYTNFILQTVQEQRMEKHQIVETFGDSYVFFFGESPRFLDCQALLINTNDFNWRAEWWYNYEKYLRGTKLVELGARCYMAWDDIVLEGYMLMAVANEAADQPYSVTLQFKFFVTNYQNVSLSNVAQFPVRSSVQLPPGVELTQSDAFSQLQAYYRGAAASQGASDALPQGQALLGSELQQGGLPVGSLASPVLTSTGPTSYAFGASAGASISASLGAGVGGGFGASAVASIGFGASASASTGAGASMNLGIGAGAQATAGFGSATTISQQIRQLPPAAVTDPSIWNAVQGTPAAGDAGQDYTQRGALRGLIAENVDEYLGGSGDSVALRPGLQDPNDPTASALSDVQMGPQELDAGLPFSVMSTLASLGVTTDQDTLDALGLGPNFSLAYQMSVSAYVTSSGYGATVGTSTSFGGASAQNVSFSPLNNASLGTSPANTVGLSALAGYYANTADNSSFIAASPYYKYRDPLGAVYGSTSATTTGFDPARYQFVEGAGNPTYGYDSPYGDVGYGQAGYGDFGGTGFGSGNSTGDPGYMNAQAVSVTSADSSVMSALSRLKFDGTALTPGPSLGSTATLGAASSHVPGVSSAFSVTSFEGSFSDWVLAATAEPVPVYGQTPTGPGAGQDTGPDLGYSAYRRSKTPLAQPYVSTVQPPAIPLSQSPGFSYFGFS